MKIRILLAGAVTVAVAAALVGCSSGSGSSDTSTTSSNKGVTLTYWASNQGASLDNDKEILTPVIDQFTKQTGIKVNLEVVPWSDLTNNTLAAAVSGQGPDVLNIGNTNAVTFQSTGAFYGWDSKALAKIGGKDHFVASSFATAGAPGQDPTSIPLYSQTYGLFYNKQIFADAGLKAPTTWEELVSDAKALTKPAEDKWGLAVPAGTVNVSMHFSYIFGAQNGGSAFDSSGKPTFTSKGMVAGVQQYVDLLSKDHVINPSDVQYTDGTQAAGEFAKGNAAMYFAQTGGINTLRQNGMDPAAYGVVPIPAPKGGKDIGSFVAGSNISIFKNTKHLDASIEFVKFMTSDKTQTTLNKAYTTIPVVKGVPAAFDASPDQLKVWTTILDDKSKPLPLVPGIQAFQANVGGAVVALMAKAATGSAVSTDDVKQALDDAQQKMGVTG
jgi:multiple sugar transport system substrate-binding protein